MQLQENVRRFLGVTPKRLYIDGEWVDAADGRSFMTPDPATGTDLALLASGGGEDVDRAVRAARAAFEGPWRATSPSARQRLLWDLAELVEKHYLELRQLEVLDMGAPIGPDPAAGARRVSDVLRYFAGWSTKIHGETISNSVRESLVTYTTREPIGVVGAIIPWNSPLSSILWKVGPAVAAGCTVVLKPAEEASLVALRMAELWATLDVPVGVFNVVTGPGETAGAALVEHPQVDKIAFTGSSATGQQIVRMAAGTLKRVSLELGGKSPDIVFADADLAKAVPGAAMGVFANSGQVCCAGTRLFVERPVYQEFVERTAVFARQLQVGLPTDPATQIGPLVSASQLERVLGYLESGRSDGARAVAGGHRLEQDGLAEGYFVPPTVLADVHDEMRVATEEIFGPVVCALPFDDPEEVVQRANATVYGLGSGVWTRDVSKAHRFAKELRSGVVWVNSYSLFDPAVPFGGRKMSGWGTELGPHAVDEYLAMKSVWIETA